MVYNHVLIYVKEVNLILSHINEEYIEEYIRSILPENKGYLKEMEKYANNNHVPIIEREVAQLLKVLLKISKPKNILEIGTAIGYSALIMATSTDNDCKITTIERRIRYDRIGKRNIQNTEYKNRINILHGEAEEYYSYIKGKL